MRSKIQTLLENIKMKDYATYLQDKEFAIFLFHGVITKNRHTVRNYTKKHLEVNEFEDVLRRLRTLGNPISMGEVVSAHKEARCLPPNSYAITFDDGFANNFHIAAPILRRHETPAMFYLTSSFVENNEGSWTDLIEYAVESVDEVRFKHDCFQPTSPIKSVADKIAFLDKIRGIVKSDANLDPYEFALELWKQNGVNRFIPDSELDQKMTPHEVAKLAADPLFMVGGHSRTHRVMSFLSSAELKAEVSTSIQSLKSWTGQEIVHYSYPEGLAHCYSEEVISCLKEYGILCSPTAIEGTNELKTDLFHLKRISII